MIYAMLEIEMRDAVEKEENLNENGSINWNFVDADAYAECRSFWKDDEDFYDSFNEIADMTIFTSTKSWYNGSNIEDKANAFLPFIGVPVYTEKLEEITSNNYQGFIFDISNK